MAALRPKSRDRSLSVGDKTVRAIRPRTADPLSAQGEEGDDDDSAPPSGLLKRFGGFEDLLQHRPVKEELIERNILKPDNVSAKLQGVQEQLKRSQLEDALRNKLQRRPEQGELLDHNILKASAEKSGAIVAKQEKLKRAQLEDSLGKAISNRPAEQQLIENHILEQS